MPTTNTHGLKEAILWVILYARVSTDEQARSGYSIAQQLERGRQWAAERGYEVLAEIVDAGQSRTSLERPGMDEVRDLVVQGGVVCVWAQDRDRFAREPAYLYLLRREFEEYGTKLTADNDRGDESPEGELTDSILDQLAKYERAKIAERTRRGKLRKAREGKVIAAQRPNYGFKYNATRDGYEVHEEAMSVVRRIYFIVGVEGRTIHTVKRTLENEGVPAPNGGKWWSKAFIRDCILDDVYKPHTYEEIRRLVTREVAAGLDPERHYGVWWFNRYRRNRTRVSESGPHGRRYRQRTKIALKPRAEWAAVPVPDSGTPREWVDAARVAVHDNKSCSSAGRRFWKLSGGIFYCGSCGRRMSTTTTNPSRGYHYYRCTSRMRNGDDACSLRKTYRADGVEADVWRFVSGLLKDPDRLRAGLETMIQQERERLRGDPEAQATIWLSRLAEVDRMRSGYQDQQAAGFMTLEELGEKLRLLENTRKTAQRELEALCGHRERLEELERDKSVLLESYADMLPSPLDGLTAEERNRIYRMLRLKVLASEDKSIEISGVLGTKEPDFKSWGSDISTRRPSKRIG
jgi:site-specific DNA recombinase